MKAKLVGINHVAIAVGDVDEALAWYGRCFRFGQRGHGFVDIADQFLALGQHPHFGLVVDDKEAARSALREAGVTVSTGPSLDFRDPWGNHVQVVDYREVQFLKAPEALRALGVQGLEKTERALEELRAKGILGS